MRKVVSLLSAVGASFALAASASAASISLVGPNTPGLNTYNIVLTFTTAEGVGGYATSVSISGGTYTGVFTNTNPGAFPILLPITSPPVNGNTGVAGSWAATSFSAQTGNTYTIGTVQIQTTPGEVRPFFTANDGVVTSGGAQVATTLTGVTIVPEPATAALLGLGLAGLVMVGRRSRA